MAIGTSHGAYKFKGEARLDFDRLEEIGKRLPGYPLVLHGASSVPQEFVEACNRFGGQVGGARGVPEDMLRKAAGMGVCKINVDTDIRLAVTASIRQYLAEHPEPSTPPRVPEARATGRQGYGRPQDPQRHGIFRQGLDQSFTPPPSGEAAFSSLA